MMTRLLKMNNDLLIGITENYLLLAKSRLIGFSGGYFYHSVNRHNVGEIYVRSAENKK